MTDEAKNVLNKALEVLERDGWCQGTAHDADGRHCALGAIQVATHSHVVINLPDGAAWRLRKAIGGPPGRIRGIAGWNDDPHRTYEDVVLVFKKAIYDA